MKIFTLTVALFMILASLVFGYVASIALAAQWAFWTISVSAFVSGIGGIQTAWRS